MAIRDDELFRAMEACLVDLLPRLNERDRRLALATEEKSWGRGGISAVHDATGASRDDDLHRRLKEHAAQEGQSLNDLVAAVLADAVTDRRESFRRRLERACLRVLPPVPMQRPPTLDDVLDANRGSGTAVSDALRAERDAR
ncbi:MAG: hypothetical protein ACRDRP_17570 [Pseudonocardiaceae bacterium]